MAYMTKDGKGPYPCHKGDYCGNYHPDYPHYPLHMAKFHHAQVRHGRPRPCKAGTTAVMKAMGMVGLYLREDVDVPPGATLLPTPNNMREPVAVTNEEPAP